MYCVVVLREKVTMLLSPLLQSVSIFLHSRYRVVVSYPPQSEAELELKEGDIVFVHKKREDGWFKGTLQRNGKTGLFPGSFAESIWNDKLNDQDEPCTQYLAQKHINCAKNIYIKCWTPEHNLPETWRTRFFFLL